MSQAESSKDILTQAEEAAVKYAADLSLENFVAIHVVRYAYLAGVTEGVRLAAKIHEEVVTNARG